MRIQFRGKSEPPRLCATCSPPHVRWSWAKFAELKKPENRKKLTLKARFCPTCGRDMSVSASGKPFRHNPHASPPPAQIE